MDFQPSQCPIHVRNELLIPASNTSVWAWLIRAVLWPYWYPNSNNVRYENSAAHELAAGMKFEWETFGVSLKSTLVEFFQPERIAWRAIGTGVDAYHAWFIEPRGEGCWVLTEETQHGWLSRLGNLLLPKRMSHHHQIWLEELSRQDTRGLPPIA